MVNSTFFLTPLISIISKRYVFSSKPLRPATSINEVPCAAYSFVSWTTWETFDFNTAPSFSNLALS